jgi:hypothetical protein
MNPHSAAASPPASTADDGVAPSAALELHVAELRQLFNAMDPAPFRERDLDPKAVAYILDWGREAPSGGPLALVVHLGREPATPASAGMLLDAVHTYFRLRAVATRRQLRQLFRVGRMSLLIGVAFLGGAIVVSEFVAGYLSDGAYGSLIRESFVIGGWVALWRPLEIFLYDWWPIRAEARLHDRLSVMDVQLLGAAPDTAQGAAP